MEYLEKINPFFQNVIKNNVMSMFLRIIKFPALKNSHTSDKHFKKT